MLLSCSFERCLSSALSNTLPSWWKEQSQEILKVEKVVPKEDGLGLHETRGRSTCVKCLLGALLRLTCFIRLSQPVIRSRTAVLSSRANVCPIPISKACVYWGAGAGGVKCSPPFFSHHSLATSLIRPSMKGATTATSSSIAWKTLRVRSLTKKASVWSGEHGTLSSEEACPRSAIEVGVRLGSTGEEVAVVGVGVVVRGREEEGGGG